jgi:hypothetical protein
MASKDFKEIKKDFALADVPGKIDVYINAEGLTQEQYKELLRMFPLDQLGQLEEALG